jgi:hypothetical protein
VSHRLTLDESQRQLVLMALAHLAIERPGWDHVLNDIALKVDYQEKPGRGTMYDGFRQLRQLAVKG